MALDLRMIATIVSGLVEGTKLVSAQLPKKSAGTSDNRSSSDVLTGLESRIAAVETHEKDQDRLLRGLAEQLENLVVASEQLNSRVKLLFVLSAAAFVLSAGTLLFVLLRG
ncbi:MAG: hypothetical protein HGA39_04855 [Coriobacteriia bacterium]|nr:hypothetical protein [Coriobacteriia bacterium]